MAAPMPGPAYQGLSRTIQIPACVLSVDDFRRLFVDLDALTREVTSVQIDLLQLPAGVAPADFASLKQKAKAEAGVVMYVYGRNGEQVALHAAATIIPEVLPDRLANITFDSGARFKIQLNYDPLNRFRLIFDFTESPVVVGYDPWNQPTPNGSQFEIIGSNQTWVAGVSDRVLSFLGARTRSRRWLHGATTFTLLNWFIGLPASFWLIYRLDSVTQRLTSDLPSALRVGVYVYIFLLVLLAFRALIYILRWLFPIIELEGSRSKAARATGGVIALGLVTALIYDVLKAAFK